MPLVEDPSAECPKMRAVSGTELWSRALEGLVRDRAIGKGEDGVYYLAE